MARLSKLIFGYRKVEIKSGNRSEILAILLKKRITAEFISVDSFLIPESDVDRLTSAIPKDYQYDISEPHGAFGVAKRAKNKLAVMTAIAVSLMLMLLSSNVVWDIRVEGADGIPESAILFSLSECGFRVGALWPALELSDVENEFLSQTTDVSWININRRGTVAYVTVARLEPGGDSAVSVPDKYANVVSTADCVIEEITVTSGTAMVKAGDAVKKGDVLIAGVVPGENGGDFCRAEGRVLGRMSDTVSVSVDKNHTEKILVREQLASLNVKFFGFSVNIFKIYGNRDEECGIIEDTDSYSILGECKLPIETVKTYRMVTEEITRTLSTAEMVRMASRLLNSATYSRLLDADLISISTIGGFTDTGYEISSKLVFVSEVGATSPFDVGY